MASANVSSNERGQGAPAGSGLIATLALANFVGMLGAASYGPFLPVMAAAFGVGIPLLGQLPAASMLLAAALGLLVGPLADAYGHRRTLVIGLLAVVVSTLGTGLALTFAALLATILIGAVGRAAILPVALTIAGTRFAGDARRRAIGIAQAGVACAPLAGIPLLTTIAAFSDWRVAFVVLALLGVGVAPLVWWAVGRGDAPAVAPSTCLRLGGVLAAYAPLVRHRPTLGLVGATLLGNASLWMVLSYIGAFYVQRHGFGIQQVGLATIPPGIALVFGSLVAGGRLGGAALRPLVAGGRSACAALLAVTMLLPLPAGPVIALLTLNAGLMSVTMVATILLLTAESPANRATTLALNGSANSLGIALGGALGGLLLAFGDYPALGVGALALGGAGAALAWWSRARTPCPRPCLRCGPRPASACPVPRPVARGPMGTYSSPTQRTRNPHDQEDDMSSETNIAIVRRYIEEWVNQGDEAALHAVVAPDWRSHGTQTATATPAGLPTGVAGAKQLHDEVHAIWPDNRFSIEDIFGAGDRVVARMIGRTTHGGTYRGIPATGRRVVFGTIWIFRLADGKVAEVWRCADDLGRVVQIGGKIVPADGEREAADAP